MRKTLTIDGLHELNVADGTNAFVFCYAKKGRLTCQIGKDATLHLFLMTLGDESDCSVTSTCVGRNATSTIDWVFFAHGKEKQKLSARNVFNAEGGAGEITMKGVAQDTAFTKVDGMIEIGEKGNKTETYLTESVLMLDPTARVEAVPGLEIRTNDVKASHSATIAKISPEDLFYMKSRGLPEEDARALLIEGFLGELTERIEDEALRKEVRAELLL